MILQSRSARSVPGQGYKSMPHEQVNGVEEIAISIPTMVTHHSYSIPISNLIISVWQFGCSPILS
jgi:hypothetical protein